MNRGEKGGSERKIAEVYGECIGQVVCEAKNAKGGGS